MTNIGGGVTWQKSFLSTPSPRETGSRYTSVKNLLSLHASSPHTIMRTAWPALLGRPFFERLCGVDNQM